MGVFIFWLLCGIVAAYVASNKGRSGCGWLIAGLLLGPFGILMAFAAPRDQAAIEAGEIAAGTARRCPACAEVVRVEAVKCKHCGAALPAPVAVNQRPPGMSLRDILVLAFFGAGLALFVVWIIGTRA